MAPSIGLAGARTTRSAPNAMNLGRFIPCSAGEIDSFFVRHGYDPTRQSPEDVILAQRILKCSWLTYRLGAPLERFLLPILGPLLWRLIRY